MEANVYRFDDLKLTTLKGTVEKNEDSFNVTFDQELLNFNYTWYICPQKQIGPDSSTFIEPSEITDAAISGDYCIIIKAGSEGWPQTTSKVESLSTTFGKLNVTVSCGDITIDEYFVNSDDIPITSHSVQVTTDDGKTVSIVITISGTFAHYDTEDGKWKLIGTIADNSNCSIQWDKDIQSVSIGSQIKDLVKLDWPDIDIKKKKFYFVQSKSGDYILGNINLEEMGYVQTRRYVLNIQAKYESDAIKTALGDKAVDNLRYPKNDTVLTYPGKGITLANVTKGILGEVSSVDRIADIKKYTYTDNTPVVLGPDADFIETIGIPSDLDWTSETVELSELIAYIDPYKVRVYQKFLTRNINTDEVSIVATVEDSILLANVTNVYQLPLAAADLPKQISDFFNLQSSSLKWYDSYTRINENLIVDGKLTLKQESIQNIPDAVVYGCFVTPKEITIEYQNRDGGILGTEQAYIGQKITIPNFMTDLKGYVFKRWVLTDINNNKFGYNSGAQITLDETMVHNGKIQFVPEYSTAIFDVVFVQYGNGAVIPRAQPIPAGAWDWNTSTFNLPDRNEYPFYKEGYEFVGWTFNPDATADSSDVVKEDKMRILDGLPYFTSNKLYVYCVWKPLEYTLILNNDIDRPEVHKYTDTITLTPGYVVNNEESQLDQIKNINQQLKLELGLDDSETFVGWSRDDDPSVFATGGTVSKIISEGTNTVRLQWRKMKKVASLNGYVFKPGDIFYNVKSQMNYKYLGEGIWAPLFNARY